VGVNISNSWAEFAGCFEGRERSISTMKRPTKLKLKALPPESAEEAVVHGIRAKRSKAGAISFDIWRRRLAMQRPLKA
jgi:hypothetical protein